MVFQNLLVLHPKHEVLSISNPEILKYNTPQLFPLPPNRHHQSNGDCREGNIMENYQVSSMQYNAQYNAHTYEQT